jgi:hypothetical protein
MDRILTLFGTVHMFNTRFSFVGILHTTALEAHKKQRRKTGNSQPKPIQSLTCDFVRG